MRENEELVELITYHNYAEYGKIELALKENGIKFLNRSFEDSAYDGIYTLSYGLGKIYVFKNDLEKAKKILKKINLL